MTRFVVITSGKGGVGKTTTAINLGTALTNFGRDVIVLDGNLSTPNVGIHLGAPLVPITLNDVLDGKNEIHEATYIHPSGLKIILSNIGMDRYKKDHLLKLKSIITNLENKSEVVIIDGAAGLGNEAISVMSMANEAIIVTTPDLPSVTDALKACKTAEKNSTKVIGLIVTKVNNDNLELSIPNIEMIIGKPVIGVIPNDNNIRKSLFMKNPVNFTHPTSQSSVAYKKIAAKLIGEKYVESIEEKESIFKFVLRRLGLS